MNINFLDEILGLGIDLNVIGVNNKAFNKNDAFRILDFCLSEQILVLGGDVYEKVDDKIKINYDNWFYESKNKNIKESIDLAKKYIKEYNTESKNIFFVFVIDN